MSGSSVLLDTIEKDVRPWLSLVEDLHQLNLEAVLNVPQICVMGDQSSGKSSVLEALSGIPFPRGAGLVTRCPIRLSMRKARVGEFWNAVVSTSISPNERFPVTEVNALSAIITKLTSSLCDTGTTGFSTNSINIELVSPDACDLTVVDLPGIIRTVTAGQSVHVIEEVNKLIQMYLKDPRTIILAVIPANQDIATVDILERALSVDPTGSRTLGVLTKTDLIGPGGETELLEVVNNLKKPLALGYIMVKNRSQKDLNNNVSAREAKDNEIEYFSNHPAFKNLDNKLYGINNLSKKLTLLLVSRIQSELSPIRSQVESSLNEVRAELRNMTTTFVTSSLTSSIQDRQKLLVSIMQEYLRHLTDGVRGEYRDRLMIRNADLRLYTRVLQSFDDFSAKINSKSPAFKSKEFINDLVNKIEQLRGKELPGFLSSQAFTMCMSQYVDMWKIPMQEMIFEVREKAQDVCGKLADVMLVQFPALKDAIKKVTTLSLSESMDEVNKRLIDHLQREKDPFTMNDFLQQWVNKIRFDRFCEAVDLSFETTQLPASNWNGLKDDISNRLRSWYSYTHSVSSAASAQDMAAILEAYWNLSAKRFIDSCCMAADREVLGKLSSQIQDYMYQHIQDSNKLAEFFTEDPVFVSKRRIAERKRDLLLQTSNTLASIPITITPVIVTKAVIPPPPVATNPNSMSLKRVTLTINVGSTGFGFLLVDGDDNKLAIKGFRKEVNPNPSLDAGMLVGDIIESINGKIPANPEEAIGIMKLAKGKVNVTVLRK